MTAREKAAFVIGMVRAFKASQWPRHFNREDIEQWTERAHWAQQMLDGGTFSPVHAFKVLELYDDEVNDA
jgi:hypothetical protein